MISIKYKIIIASIFQSFYVFNHVPPKKREHIVNHGSACAHEIPVKMYGNYSNQCTHNWDGAVGYKRTFGLSD